MIDIIKSQMNEYDIKYSLSVKRLDTGQEFNINENEVVPSASTIKVFIMAEAIRQMKEGIVKNERIKVSTKDYVPYSIISLLNPENTYTMMDLITLMIIQSDNTATNVLIDILGMDKINAFIKSIECNSTILERKMMDLDVRKRGLENKTTSKDLTHFMELLYKGRIVDEKSSKTMIDIMKHQLDSSMMRYFIPEEIEVANKTGELDGIDNDTGIVYLNKGDYIFTMMTRDAKSNNEARFAIAQVSKIVYEYFCKYMEG
ncbi:serine hydrolase [Caloramator sp. E03]|uniref:serine hydrolase n=1 Tax=Caloramator sp. E03 TaxID=2576307 RepID=UPI00143D199D|nr:serine hydrolase [Caloramator sp. E03]